MVELCEALLSQTTSVPPNGVSVFSVVKKPPNLPSFQTLIALTSSLSAFLNWLPAIFNESSGIFNESAGIFNWSAESFNWLAAFGEVRSQLREARSQLRERGSFLGLGCRTIRTNRQTFLFKSLHNHSTTIAQLRRLRNAILGNGRRFFVQWLCNGCVMVV